MRVSAAPGAPLAPARGSTTGLRAAILALAAVALMVSDHRQDHLALVRTTLNTIAWPLRWLVHSPVAAGEWLGQLLGNCPYEEVLFRGFLLPQCGLLAMRWVPKARPRALIAVALVLSQALFAVGHVFLNLHLPEGQWLLVAQFVFGLMFAFVYLHTGNLFLAMGLHALLNNPAPLIDDPLPGPGASGSIVLVGIMAWLISLAWAKRPASRATNGPS